MASRSTFSLLSALPYRTPQSAELQIIPLNTADPLHDTLVCHITKLATSIIGAKAMQHPAGEASSHRVYTGSLLHTPGIIDYCPPGDRYSAGWESSAMTGWKSCIKKYSIT